MPTATDYPCEVKFNLTPEMGRLLIQRAMQEGISIDTYVFNLLHRNLARPNIDEILAPFRSEVATSGMTQEELDQFFKGVRKEVSALNRQP